MKKLISILSAMVVLLSMTACGKGDEEIKSKSTTTTTVQTTTTTTHKEQPEIEPLPVPEGEWTAEELAKTIRINGELISIPFTIDSLGEGYTYSEESDFIEHEGIKVVFVAFDNEKEIANKKIISLSSLKDQTNNALTINGIGLGSKYSEMEKALGIPSKTIGSVHTFYTTNEEDTFLLIIYDDNNEISTIIYYFI